MNQAPLRLRRITDPATGRAILLSFTSGMEIGVAPGMADLAGTVIALAATGQLTGAIVHAGVKDSILHRFPSLPCGTIIDLFGGTWMTAHPERREQICSVEQAVRVGGDAVFMTVSLGSSDETRQLHLCGRIARESRDWGLPLVVRIDTTETDAKRQYSATLTGHGARLAYELGADMVAVNYSGEPETFAEALKGVDIPVLISGAANLATDQGLIESIQQAMQAGASGIALSASIFWDGGAARTLDRVAGLVRSASS